MKNNALHLRGYFTARRALFILLVALADRYQDEVGHASARHSHTPSDSLRLSVQGLDLRYRPCTTSQAVRLSLAVTCDCVVHFTSNGQPNSSG